MDNIDFIAKLVPTLQKLALSSDKNSFINSLQQGYEKTIIKLITAPYENDLKKKMIQGGIPAQLANKLQDDKLFEKLFEAKNSEEVAEELKEIQKMWRINFNHPRPMQSNMQEMLSSIPMQNLLIPSKLQTNDNLVSLLKSKLSESENNIQYISDYGIRVLPEDVLKALTPESKENILRRDHILCTFGEEFMADFVLLFYEQIRKKIPLFQLPLYIINNLTTPQLNLLAEKEPNFFASSHFSTKYFRSNYEQQFEFLKTENKWLTFQEKEQKRKVLKQIYEKIKDINNIALVDYENQIFLELMIVDLSIEDPDVDRYVTFLKMLRQPIPLLNKNYRENLMKERQNPYIFHSDQLQSAKLGMSKFTEDYLMSLFKKYDLQSLDTILLKFLDEKVYFEHKARVILNRGDELGILDKVLSEDEKAKIAARKYITLSEKNKKKFNVDEEVVLTVKVKNIKNIKVKVYELNLEKQYLEDSKEIEDTINLNYLEPTFSFIYEHENTNTYKQNIYDIKIDKIKKERGIYVVDLQGDGISSRAVIRKGSIFCFKKMTLAGIQLKFYDEEGKRIEKLNLWIRGKKVNVNKSYVIPFSETRQNLQVIVLVDSYAELISVNIPAEEYSLDVSCIYNQETFIVGNKAKIIMHPRLSIMNYSDRNNKEQISLKLLKNIRIKVEIQNSLGIKSSLNFENVDWISQEDYVLEFPIQSYTKNVSILVSSEIKKYTGKTQELCFRKNIDIDLRENGPMFIDFYLNKSKDEFVLDVLGKNGEPIPNFNTTITFLQQAYLQIEQKSLKSDENGKIYLGPLKLVNSLALTTNSQVSNHLKTWAISNKKLQVCLLDFMSFKEGQTITIPIPEGSLNLQNDACLLKKKKNTILSNCTNNMKINGRFLQISNLSEGSYILKLLSIDHEMKITVIKGNQWEQPNQVYNSKKQTVYEFNRSPNHYLCLGSAQIKPQQQSNSIEVKIQMPEGCKLGEGIKAHVLASNFIAPSHLDDILPPQNNKFRDLKINKFEHQYNTYYSDKKLSEEDSYVLNRKNQKQFIGNNMEKPHMFLNRIKVRSTSVKDQQLQFQQGYKKKERNYHQMEDDFGFAPELEGRRESSLVLPNTSINAHNNFLAHGGITIPNIKGDVISFKLPKWYSNFSIVLMSNNSCLKKKYSVGCEVEKKKIVHPGIKDSNDKSAWTMSREVKQLQKGQQIVINRNSKWCAVSLQNIVNFAKLKGVSLDDWILNWNHYSHDKKLQTYNKSICHQLNCFIKHNDPKFWNQVSLPYIQNKIEKTFVDLCLLQCEECMKWIQAQFFMQLNDFEKILLIEFLIKKKQDKIAERIASTIMLKQKTKKQPFKNFKKQFDTVISAKMMEEAMQPIPKKQAFGSVQNNPMELLGSNAPPRASTGFGGMPPPPPPGMSMPPSSYAASQSANLFGMAAQSVQMQMMPMNASIQPSMAMDLLCMDQQKFAEDDVLIQMRDTYEKPFTAVEKTDQYTEVTYSGVKQGGAFTNRIISPAQFWADLANHLIKNPQKQFLSHNFMYLNDKISFTVAAAFLPNNCNAQFEIKNEGENFIISAKTSFLVFVKEIKELDYQPKFGIMINHRFFDPQDQYSYEEDGLKVQKEVEEFVVQRQYSLQTVVTNTSGTALEVQLLIDIPQGSLPLRTHEYTQIVSTTIQPFSTQSFQRYFYFPSEGKYSFYPSNACWDKTVIGKANQHEDLQVIKQQIKKNLQSFTDVIRSGTQEEILTFLKEKNIFDKNMFEPQQILWMLKDKSVFEKMIALMKDRGYFSQDIWQYGFLHNDVKVVQEYLHSKRGKNPNSLRLNIFEYYPYYSMRSHKFLNQSKSTIRNVEFKQTYFNYLFYSLINNQQQSAFKLSLAYYLLLQDRIDQASKCFKMMNQEQKRKYKLQTDYFECFLDMYEGYPNFSNARKISNQYIAYPVESWRKLFKEINDTLKDYDSTTYVEEQTKIQYKTVVYNEGQQIRVNIPPKTKVQVLLFPVNLQLYFSSSPFNQLKSFSAIKPARVVTYESGQSREEKLKRQENMKDVIVQVYSTAQGLPARKVESFLWTNPKVKVKMNENKGNLQLFLQGRHVSGAYCKVYSIGMKGQKFYRDGYTDITGTFKYALTDLQEVDQFSIVVITDKGGSINKVRPPSESGYLDY